MVPLAMKYMESRMSPGCTNVSPGGACVDLNFIDKARKQPGQVRIIHFQVSLLNTKSLAIPLAVVAVTSLVSC